MFEFKRSDALRVELETNSLLLLLEFAKASEVKIKIMSI